MRPTHEATYNSEAPLRGWPPVVGQFYPNIVLRDQDGQSVAISDFRGKVVVLEWFNPDCPFIKKHHLDHKTMDETFAAVADEKVVWLAINSGAPGQQGAGWERNQKAHKDFEMTFPVLMDESGEIGKAYGAKTTPHMFIVNPLSGQKLAGLFATHPPIAERVARLTGSRPAAPQSGNRPGPAKSDGAAFWDRLSRLKGFWMKPLQPRFRISVAWPLTLYPLDRITRTAGFMRYNRLKVSPPPSPGPGPSARSRTRTERRCR